MLSVRNVLNVNRLGLSDSVLIELVRFIPGDGEPFLAEASNVISEVVTILVGGKNALNGLNSLSVKNIDFTDVVSLDIRNIHLSSSDLFVEILLTVLDENFQLVVVRLFHLSDLLVCALCEASDALL